MVGRPQKNAANNNPSILGHKLFEDIFDSASNGLILLDGTFHILRVGNGLCHLLGYQQHELFGKYIRQIISPLDWDDALLLLKSLTADGPKSHAVERRYLHKDGQIIWVIAAISALPACHQPGMPAFALQVTSIDKQKRAEKTVEEALVWWNFALDSAGQGVWDCDVPSDTWSYSASWKRMRGIPEDEAILLDDENWIKEIHPEDHDLVLAKMAERFAAGMTEIAYEYRQRHRHGHWMWILARGRCIEMLPDGRPKRIIGTDTDITEIRAREAELADVSHRLEMALSTSEVGIWKYDVFNSATYWDWRTREIFGLERDDGPLAPRTWENLVHPDDLDCVVKICETGVATRQDFEMDYRIVLADGTLKYIRARASFPTTDTGHETMIGVNWDVTPDVEKAEAFKLAKLLAENRSLDLEVARSHLEHASLHDSLTGLPNRRHLDHTLARYQQGAKRGQSLTLLQIDLDRFKQINDTKGHAAGDAVLVQMASMLRNQFRDSDLVARIGGDEFVILLSPSPDRRSLQHIVDRMISVASQPILWQGQECRCGVSVGIAQSPGDIDPRQLLVNADIALYRAKNSGRNCAIYFTGSLQAEVLANQQCADDLIKGLKRREFIAFYQPIIHAQTRDIAGVEALARWQHPTQGLLTPDKFLTVADEVNALNTIDHMILEQALADLKVWDALALGIPKISVNVTARRLSNKDLLHTLKSMTVEPGRISFELLESIFLDDHKDHNAQNIDAIKALGIGIDVDDFGTGHASIIGLLRLSPNRMKIDRQLTRHIVENEAQRKLVSSLIEIGKSQGIHVCAEGVETADQAHVLTHLGCDFLQGFHLAQPMSAAELIPFVQAQTWRRDCQDVSGDNLASSTLSRFMRTVGIGRSFDIAKKAS